MTVMKLINVLLDMSLKRISQLVKHFVIHHVMSIMEDVLMINFVP